MAEETQTPELVDEFSLDDASALQYVLEHVRGATPVSVYNQAEFLSDDE
ncbi:MAG TPA: hypothetical protein PKV96_02415 [Candidatus Saccharimonas sp.]|jgi:hypothetical protein|nr:hypothetical protein [Candidatus Saccharimonas sp.]